MNVLRFAVVGASIALSSALSFAQAPAVAPPSASPPSASPPAAAPPVVAPAPVPPPSYGSPPPYYAPYGQPPPYMMSPPPTETRMVRHSGALMGGGIGLTAFGVISAIGGATAFAEDGHSGGSQGILSLLVGLPLLIHAAGCLAGGIPMIVIGNRKIPIEIPHMMPTMVSSRGGAGLGWKF